MPRARAMFLLAPDIGAAGRIIPDQKSVIQFGRRATGHQSAARLRQLKKQLVRRMHRVQQCLRYACSSKPRWKGSIKRWSQCHPVSTSIVRAFHQARMSDSRIWRSYIPISKSSDRVVVTHSRRCAAPAPVVFLRWLQPVFGPRFFPPACAIAAAR